jgi:hypothetical protein
VFFLRLKKERKAKKKKNKKHWGRILWIKINEEFFNNNKKKTAL